MVTSSHKVFLPCRRLVSINGEPTSLPLEIPQPMLLALGYDSRLRDDDAMLHALGYDSRLRDDDAMLHALGYDSRLRDDRV